MLNVKYMSEGVDIFSEIIDTMVSILVGIILNALNGFIFGIVVGFSQTTGLPTDESGIAIYTIKTISSILGTSCSPFAIFLFSILGLIITIVSIKDDLVKLGDWRISVLIYSVGVLMGFLYAITVF